MLIRILGLGCDIGKEDYVRQFKEYKCFSFLSSNLGAVEDKQYDFQITNSTSSPILFFFRTL